MAALTPPHWEATTPALRAALEHVGRQPFARRFYLAGGTALALRIGHRRSIDLDFFSDTDELLTESRRAIVAALAPLGAAVVEDTTGNLLLRLSGFHVAFLSYGYPLVAPPDTVAGIAVAGLVDLGLMKLDALISRGSRKDFYDLYFILQGMALEELLALGKPKYAAARDFEVMALASLVLFDNADRDHQPDLLVDVPWPDVKRFFEDEARRVGGTWF
jgi:predicted nucleotidyltransferase component of viral defense system